MKNSQKGFSVVESLLLVVILAIIGLTFWYVWHSNGQVNKQYNSVSNGTPISSKKKTSAQKAVPKAAPVISYTTTANTNGASVQNDSDIDNLDGAQTDLKSFLKDKLDKNKNQPQPCGNAYGLFVKKIYKDQFVLGGETNCKNTNKLWAKVSDQWKEIGSSDDNFDCSILKQYEVPSAIVDHCMQNGQLTPNTIGEE